jgi:hypothetical protein
MLSVLSFTSCSSDDEVGSTSDLIGGWLLYSEQGWEKENGVKTDEWNNTDLNDIRIYFYEDGTCTQEEYYNKRWYKVDGTYSWSLNGSKLRIRGIDDDGDEEDEIGIVKTLNNTTFEVEHTDKYKEDGITYEEYNRQVYKKISD